MEASILLALQSIRIDGLTQLMALFSALGNHAFIWLVLGAIMWIPRNTRWTGILIWVSIAVVFIVSEVIIEPHVARIRPCDAGIGVVAVPGVSHSGFSFPSGHSVSGFAAATVITLTQGKRMGTPALVFALIVAFSRLYLGVHYPTDVAAGILMGAVIGLVVVWVYNTFFGYNNKERVPRGQHSRGRVRR